MNDNEDRSFLVVWTTRVIHEALGKVHSISYRKSQEMERNLSSKKIMMGKELTVQ